MLKRIGRTLFSLFAGLCLMQGDAAAQSDSLPAAKKKRPLASVLVSGVTMRFGADADAAGGVNENLRHDLSLSFTGARLRLRPMKAVTLSPSFGFDPQRLKYAYGSGLRMAGGRVAFDGGYAVAHHMRDHKQPQKQQNALARLSVDVAWRRGGDSVRRYFAGASHYRAFHDEGTVTGLRLFAGVERNLPHLRLLGRVNARRMATLSAYTQQTLDRRGGGLDSRRSFGVAAGYLAPARMQLFGRFGIEAHIGPVVVYDTREAFSGGFRFTASKFRKLKR